MQPSAKSIGEFSNATTTVAHHVAHDIEAMLGRRSAKEGTFAEALETKLKNAGIALWKQMKRHPFLSVGAIAIGATAAASAVGVAELSFAGAIAYAAYKVIREGETPKRALEEVEREAHV